MSRSMLRLTALSASLLLAPAMTHLARAADEPAPPPRTRDGDRGERPRGEDRPRDARPGEGRPGEGRPGEGRPEGRGDPAMMFERFEAALADLGLSTEQKTKIDEAIAKAKKSLEEQKDAEPRARMQAAQAAMGDLRQSVEATLNDDQKKQLAEKLPARGRPGEGRPGPGGDPRGGQLAAALEAALDKADLTAEQKAKVKEAFLAEMQKMREGGGARPAGDRPDGARPQGDRPRGDRPQGDRPQGDRPRGERPQGDRPPRPDAD